VEPVSLLDIGEIQQVRPKFCLVLSCSAKHLKFQVFARANHFMPRQRPGEYEYQYKIRLSQVC